MPQEAKKNLSDFGHLLELSSHGIVYDAISGHPDIFFCQTPKCLIAAPNTPGTFLNELVKAGILFSFGAKELQNIYPFTSIYNAVLTSEYLIHNLKNTDNIIISENKHLKTIHVKQSYTRCNLICLDEKHFITSDKGIEKKLNSLGLNIFYVEPTRIYLQGMKHGFFGGCCGIFENKLLVTGSIKFLSEFERLTDFVRKAQFEIIELYKGQLYDVGGIFFVST